MKLLLVGNYGASNLGDEALREYFLSRFSGHSWSVISAKARAPHELPRLPCGLRSLFSPWYRTLVAIARSDVLVFGGGTLFSDTESLRACFIWCSHAFAAFLFGTPVFLVFQGIGPFRTALGRHMTRYVVRRATFISVRDELSLKRVTEMGRADATLTFDPVFTLPEAYAREDSPHSLVLIPRGNSSPQFYNECVAYIRQHSPRSVEIVSMYPDDDAAAIGHLSLLLRSLPVTVALHTASTWQELCAFLNRASFVLTQRYHGAICSLALSIPFRAVPLADGDKLSRLTTRSHAEFHRLCTAGEDAFVAALSSTRP